MINGIQRPLLNGKFVFPFGTLDQGYWPDGIYTPPTVEAMTFDLRTLKNVGYNMIRKHIKVEPALYYKACDEIGLLVIQDMPSLRPDLPDPNNPGGIIRLEPGAQPEFDRQVGVLVEQLRSYTSIFAWVCSSHCYCRTRSHLCFRLFIMRNGARLQARLGPSIV